MIAVTGGLGPAADRGEMARRVDMIDAKDRETALEGIAPSSAGSGEGVHKIAGKLAVDDVGRGSVKIAAEDRGSVGKFRGLLENLLSQGKFLYPE